MEEAALLKVRILGNDCISVSVGVLPDGEVISITQSNFPNVDAFGVNVAQSPDEAIREILIKQQFHVEGA